MDVLISETQTSIHDMIGKCDSYVDAVKLIKVWLHQRGLDKVMWISIEWVWMYHKY